MRKKINNGLLVICILSLCLLPAGAGNASQPPEGGTLQVAMVTEPKVLDSCASTWACGPMAGNVFNSLLETDDKLNIIPGLASAYEIDYDKKQYRFTLQQNVKWHDGKPFTAEDVKFTLENILPKYDNRGLYLKDTKVQIINDKEILVKPGTWAPGIQLARFASIDWAIYPKHILEKENFLRSKFRKAPIGTGPFKFGEWQRGSHIILVKNDSYWRPNKPYLDKIIFKFMREPSMILAAITSGEVDFVFRGLPYEAYQTIKNAPNLNLLLDYKPCYKLMLSYNLKHPILSNKKVRKAIAFAMDRKDMAQKATSGVCRPSNRVFASEFLPENPNITFYPYDSAKANALLDEAGYAKKANGQRFSLNLITRAGEAEEEKAADLLHDYLQDVGIELTIQKADFSTVGQRKGNYNFDLAIDKRWVLPVYSYQNHHTRWIKPGVKFVNATQYSNKDVDYLYNQWAYDATSQDDRIKALLGVETQVLKDLPDIGLVDVSWMYVWSSKVGNAFVPVGNWVQCKSYENLYIKK